MATTTFARKLPKLVWCGISGYGPDGPYRDKKAYDLLVQAESGVLSLTGAPDAPAKVGISIADISSGLYGYSSILAALLNRQRTGAGERIDISMLECLTEWVVPPMYVWQGTGQVPQRCGVRHNMIVPYGVYRCSDGAVNLGIQNEREWRRFCEQVLDSPDLAADPRFAGNAVRLQNRVVLESMIEERFGRSHARRGVAPARRRGHCQWCRERCARSRHPSPTRGARPLGDRGISRGRHPRAPPSA